ncbi:DUF4907 domain-containing protein [Emticicia sp. C21]|uniref:DUF4907 domain-containing protein n=1 Tax=Emticicia sp. C21 TaxID=2302915 RepID=UPI000E350EF8|nr:DUF4907 domain-containing protein [Emticicia sp. C21]RFS16115.1 DUF4907 domain-containing protein [Emticicia sp. C21]
MLTKQYVIKPSLFLLSYFSIIFSAVAQKPKQEIDKNQDYGILYKYNDSLQYETYPLSDGWGYRLYIRYKLLVNQPNIPAVSGNAAFKKEADAQKIAKLASSKVANGQIPPTLTVEEVRKLIKYK